MKLVVLSDTHASHWDVGVPDGDVLIHAGDVMGYSHNQSQLRDLARWFKSLPHPHKILVPGNHDGIFQQRPAFCRDLLTDVHVLIDQAIEINGIHFYGSPWTLPFYDWYFMKDEVLMPLVCEPMPNGTDVLITHGPPKFILDTAPDGYHCGSETLLRRIREIQPKLHVFGHIHTCGGRTETSLGTTFVNASVLNDEYDVVYPPHVITL